MVTEKVLSSERNGSFSNSRASRREHYAFQDMTFSQIRQPSFVDAKRTFDLYKILCESTSSNVSDALDQRV